MLSSRGASILDIADPSFVNIKTVASDLFHPINNTRGKVNLCTAENRVCESEVSKKLQKIYFHPDTHQWMLRYAGSGGIKETKLALISHFSSLFSVSINEEEALFLPSCTAVYDVFSHLCCDPNDIILTPSPLYALIKNDCCERNRCRDIEKPELFVSDFEREFATWASKAQSIPRRESSCDRSRQSSQSHWEYLQSPSDDECMQKIRNDVFIIVDEILAGTIYTDRKLAEFPSILGLKKELSKPEYLDLGLPGIKTALVVSSSPPIREAVKKRRISALLAFLDSFFLSSLPPFSFSIRHSISRGYLCPLCHPKGWNMWSGYKFMSGLSSEEENSLHRRFIEHGVVPTKGESTVAPEPGWFRISFGVPKEELELGIRGIYSTIARDSTLKRKVDYGEKTNGIKKEWIVSEVRPTSPGTTVESA